jgi:hypothetical protein
LVLWRIKIENYESLNKLSDLINFPGKISENIILDDFLRIEKFGNKFSWENFLKIKRLDRKLLNKKNAV